MSVADGAILNGDRVSAQPGAGRVPPPTVGTTVATTVATMRTHYRAATAARVIAAYLDLQLIEDVVTISAVARRTGVSRSTVRAVLRQECGWTPAHSRLAHRAGVRRGKLLQHLAGHPGLMHGRQTLQVQGWPNLQRAQQTLKASAYSALQRGRATQAARGWPNLHAGHATLADRGYPQLAQGRANLAVRGWPNWKKARAALEAQGYLPLVESLRMRQAGGPLPLTDRRIARGRTTRLAILEAVRTCARDDEHDPETDGSAPQTRNRRVTGREIATQLHLHPTTVYAHVKQLRAQGLIE